MNEKITVPWMDKIRERLKEKYVCSPYEESTVVMTFIQPILDYGESVEKRINDAYTKNTKTWECKRRKKR